MSFPTTFANLTAGTQPATLLDSMFNVVGGMGIIPCSAAGTNAIVLTPATNFYQPAAYLNNQAVSWLQAATTTGPVTVALGGLAATPLFLYNGRQADAGDLNTNDHCVAEFFQDLNSGGGGFIVVSTAGSIPQFRQSRIGGDQSFTNNTTLATVMSLICVAGRVYSFRAAVIDTYGAGFTNITIAGTGGLTATNIIWSGTIVDNTSAVAAFGPFTTLGASGILFSGAGASAISYIDGTITVGVGGTLAVQAAQRSSNAAATIYKQGSYFQVYN